VEVVRRANLLRPGRLRRPRAYQRLKDQIIAVEKITARRQPLPLSCCGAEVFFAIVRKLGEAGLTQETNLNWTRVIVEKPFGHDLESAIQLNKELKEILSEKQIYRIRSLPR